MTLLFCIFGGRGPRHLANFLRNIKTNPNWIWYMEFIGFWNLFRDFAYDILFLHFWRGRPRVLSNFPSKSTNKSDLNWVHGFHKGFVFFLNFAYGIAFAYFCRGAGYLTNVPPKISPKQIWTGYMDLIRFWRQLGDFAYEIAFLHFCRGEAQAT